MVETMKQYLNLKKDHSISTNSLCNVAHIILTENYFEIGTDLYQKKLGTVIDMKFALQYANCLWLDLEKDIS